MQRLRFVDWATLLYLGGVAVGLVILRRTASDQWGVWLSLHVLIAMGVGWLAWRPRAGALGWLRELYPLPLFVLLYRESEALNRAIFPQPLDVAFLRWEASWFGFQPSFAFAEWMPATWFAELLYAGYFSFYGMIVGMTVWLLARDRSLARRFVGTLAGVFYVCYALFIVFPVVGPRILDLGGLSPETVVALGLTGVGPMPATSQAGPFAQVMRHLYAWFEGEGGAFPSSHVVVACLVLRESFRQQLRLRWGLAVAVVLLCLGTVYGRYHYVSDVLAGLVLVLPLVTGVEWLQRRMERNRNVALEPVDRSHP